MKFAKKNQLTDKINDLANAIAELDYLRNEGVLPSRGEFKRIKDLVKFAEKLTQDINWF